MTLDGLPETEREMTVLGLPGRPMLGGELDGCLSLADAAEAMGVPVTVLVRWCADGTVPEREGFRGRPTRAAALRFDRAWVEAWIENGEVTL